MNTFQVTLASVSVVALLASCAAAPPRYARVPQASPAPVAPQSVYAYPARGQNQQQTRRDRYECHNWAVNQSGFDPNYSSPPPEPVYDVPTVQTSYENTAFLAFTGAVIGAGVANPRNAGTGAAIGALIGGLTGAAADSARAQDTQRAIDARYARTQQVNDRYSQQANGYRQALNACLQGRGYNVR